MISFGHPVDQVPLGLDRNPLAGDQPAGRAHLGAHLTGGPAAHLATGHRAQRGLCRRLGAEESGGHGVGLGAQGLRLTIGAHPDLLHAGMRSKILPNHGMFGAYPTWPDRPSYASGTNVEELIEARRPLVHERGDPERPILARNIEAEIMETDVIAPFVTPAPLHEYDLIVHPISGAQALGDPIERDPELVRLDLDSGWTRDWVASGVYGVVARQDEETREWALDEEATERKRVKS